MHSFAVNSGLRWTLRMGASGTGLLTPAQVASATLLALYEVNDAMVTLASGDAVSIANQAGGTNPATNPNPLTQSNSLNRATYEPAGWGPTALGTATASLLFDGITDEMRADGIAATLAGTNQPFSCILLGQILTLGSNANTRSLWGLGNSADDQPLHDLRLPASTTNVLASGRRDSSGVQKVRNAATAAAGTRAVYSLVFDGAKVKFRVNGVLDASLDGVGAPSDSSLGALTGLNTFTVGALRSTLVKGNTHMRMAALCVYAGAVSDAELAGVEHYLTSRHPL